MDTQSSPERPADDSDTMTPLIEVAEVAPEAADGDQLPEAEAGASPGYRTDGGAHPRPKAARYLPGMGWAATEAITRHGALQSPGELTALLSLVEGTEAMVILEIGTFAGGSAWAFSRVPTVHHIVTVDEAPRAEAAEVLAGLPCRVTQVLGNTRLPQATRAVVSALDGFSPDLVFIDGDHLYGSARHDWETYAPMVKRGGLVVLHDTQGYPNNPTVQVPRLWAELRTSYRTTEFVDTPGGPAGTGIVWL